MSEIELKACPFCGAAAEVKGRKTSMVNCTGCSASTFQLLEDKESAVRQWNTRAPQWHPIETAPKDSSEILLCSERGQAVGYWDEDEDSFVTDYRGKGNFDFVAATHWQPLTAAPEVV